MQGLGLAIISCDLRQIPEPRCAAPHRVYGAGVQGQGFWI